MREPRVFLDGRVTLHPGDCLDVLKTISENSIDSIVTDPPYGLEFMGRDWDGADGFRRSLNKADVERENVFGRTSRTSPEYRAGHLFQEFIHAVANDLIRVLKPGGHLLAFGGTRTYHRLTCAVEDAGFEIRDAVMWHYGQGFPKSYDTAQGIEKLITTGKARRPDRELGGLSRNRFSGGIEGRLISNTGGKVELTTPEAAQWEGWGTALKPATEIIVLARKPLSEDTVAANVLRWGTGALNIGACRIATDENLNGGAYTGSQRHDGTENWRFRNGGGGRKPMPGDEREGAALGMFQPGKTAESGYVQPPGRWPANCITDGSDEVLQAFPNTESVGHAPKFDGGKGKLFKAAEGTGGLGVREGMAERHFEAGSAARFFYTAKANSDDRIGSKHPTVKPVDLIRYLCRLITPPGGIVLDPFAGTGTAGGAAFYEGFNAVLIEREEEYQADIARRMELVLAGPDERRRAIAKEESKRRKPDPLPLFGEVSA